MPQSTVETSWIRLDHFMSAMYIVLFWLLDPVPIAQALRCKAKQQNPGEGIERPFTNQFGVR